MEGTGRCSPARLEGAAAPLPPPCRASARCSSRADAWTFKEEQEKPSQFLVTCINRGVGKGGCSFRSRLHLCGGWAPLEHPLQSLNKHGQAAPASSGLGGALAVLGWSQGPAQKDACAGAKGLRGWVPSQQGPSAQGSISSPSLRTPRRRSGCCYESPALLLQEADGGASPLPGACQACRLLRGDVSTEGLY